MGVLKQRADKNIWRLLKRKKTIRKLLTDDLNDLLTLLDTVIVIK